jgi:hypothetical protein
LTADAVATVKAMAIAEAMTASTSTNVNLRMCLTSRMAKKLQSWPLRLDLTAALSQRRDRSGQRRSPFGAQARGHRASHPRPAHRMASPLLVGLPVGAGRSAFHPADARSKPIFGIA